MRSGRKLVRISIEKKNNVLQGKEVAKEGEKSKKCETGRVNVEDVRILTKRKTQCVRDRDSISRSAKREWGKGSSVFSKSGIASENF